MFKRVMGSIIFRLILLALLVALQISLVVVINRWFSGQAWLINLVLTVISVVAVVLLLSSDNSADVKIIWMLIVLLFPLFGVLVYLLFGRQNFDKKAAARIAGRYRQSTEIHSDDSEAAEMLLKRDNRLWRQSRYIYNCVNAPVYINTSAEYFSVGEEKFARMVQMLKQAEKYIFLEYFIIKDGVMWQTICNILLEKAEKGLDIRLIYDDLGNLTSMPAEFRRRIKNSKIKTCVFDSKIPELNGLINYRDHRKICVIDGNTGFMGGINLSDQYININSKLGHWKDTAVMLQGEAVWSLTVLFLQMWEILSSQKVKYDYYLPDKAFSGDGFVQPFGDHPFNKVNVVGNCYINLINGAENYVYITTPYLILDAETINALCAAALSGVSVKIATPGIADKWYTQVITRANYRRLAENKVKIYEYTPGFMHAKMLVADDKIAVVGSANLDYRSIYQHFECCTSFYCSQIAFAVRRDIEQCIAVSKLITCEDIKNYPWHQKCLQSLLRICSPVM